MAIICQIEIPTSCTLEAWGTSNSPFSLALTNFLNDISVLFITVVPNAYILTLKFFFMRALNFHMKGHLHQSLRANDYWNLTISLVGKAKA